MKNSSCRNARNEIEELASAELLSPGVQTHLSSCGACAKLLHEQISLRELVGSLGTVTVPGDFDFRLRARLARAEAVAVRPFSFGSFSFGFRSAALAAVILLFTSGLVFVKFLPSRSLTGQAGEVTANRTGNQADEPVTGPERVTPPTSDVTANAVAANPAGISAKPEAVVAPKLRPGISVQLAGLGVGNRPTSRDLAVKRAPVLRAGPSGANYQAAAFPIDADYQSLKVSVDEGHGTSRTISLPAVSFGSQRSLSQSPTPLLASARDSW